MQMNEFHNNHLRIYYSLSIKYFQLITRIIIRWEMNIFEKSFIRVNCSVRIDTWVSWLKQKIVWLMYLIRFLFFYIVFFTVEFPIDNPILNRIAKECIWAESFSTIQWNIYQFSSINHSSKYDMGCEYYWKGTHSYSCLVRMNNWAS